MNLHAIVRGAISTVNPDIIGGFAASLGVTVDAAGNLTPAYAPWVPVLMQVQPPGTKDLMRLQNLNISKVSRAVYLFGNPQSVVRVNQQGGDLLRFPQFTGQQPSTWLVVAADGPWSVEAGGWTKVLCTLQTDPAP